MLKSTDRKAPPRTFRRIGILSVLIGFSLTVQAGFVKPKVAQDCDYDIVTQEQTKWYCPPNGLLILTGSSHRALKTNQRDRMLCAAMPNGGSEYADVNCPRYFSLWTLDDVNRWAGPFCNFVHLYKDKANRTHKYACLAPPRRR